MVDLIEHDTILSFGDDATIALRAALGFTERWTPWNEGEVRNTWNGRAIVFKSSFKLKYKISIAASGSGVWRMPAFDHLDYGDELLLHSGRNQGGRIPMGTRQTILSRDFVPGSVQVTRRLSADEEDVIPHTTLGRRIMIDHDAPQTLDVQWRALTPVLYLGVSGDANYPDGLGGWAVELAEKNAP